MTLEVGFVWEPIWHKMGWELGSLGTGLVLGWTGIQSLWTLFGIQACRGWPSEV